MNREEAIARIQSLLTGARLKYFEMQSASREAYYEGRMSAFSDALKIVKGGRGTPRKASHNSLHTICEVQTLHR